MFTLFSSSSFSDSFCWACQRFTPYMHNLVFSTKLKEIPVQTSGVIYIASSFKGKMPCRFPSASNLCLLNPVKLTHSALGFPFLLCVLKSASKQKTGYLDFPLSPPHYSPPVCQGSQYCAACFLTFACFIYFVQFYVQYSLFHHGPKGKADLFLKIK